jgi:glycosyltransferase involved in cell wall biosynthesis
VVAAGHLVPRKGFDRMITAWKPISRARPDWQLHIYGSGEQRRRLTSQIRRRRLTESVHLKGHTMAFEEVLGGASIYAMTSHEEGFPMVLVEAMTKGVPPVSMDCPRGPAEIIVDHRNGRLTPDGDIGAFSSALLDVINDDGRRAEMGRAALEDARQYTPEVIAGRWADLFERLRAARTG